MKRTEYERERPGRARSLSTRPRRPAVRRGGQRPRAAVTAEIADAVGVTRQNADQRLRRLEGEGRIQSKKIGTSLVWSLARGQQVVRHVDPEDDFWEAEASAGEEMSAEDIDDVLYR